MTKASSFLCSSPMSMKLIMLIDMPPDKSAYWKIIFSKFSTKTYVWGTQKNRLNEMILLSTQNTCKN